MRNNLLNNNALYNKKALLLSIGALLTLPLPAWAKAIATVSQNSVEVSQPFQLMISVDDNLDASAIDFSTLTTDFVVGRPRVSSSTSIVNSSVSRKTEWRVPLAAIRQGSFTIPSFNINGDTTAPISIKVTGEGQASKALAENIQITANLDRDSGYEGESFLYNVRLLIGTRVENPTLDAPSAEGVTVSQLGEDVQAEAVLNGKQYVVFTRTYQLTPTKAGKFNIQGASLKGTEIKGGGWGNSLGMPVNMQAQPLTLEIKAKPADYKGFWLPTEDLQLEQYWEPEQKDGRMNATVGEPINRIIQLKVKNTAQSALPNIKLTYPPSVRAYPEKPGYSQDGDYVVMQIKEVIIAREAGKITLPSLTVDWFDTKTGKAQTAIAAGIELEVAPSATQSMTVAAPSAPQPAASSDNCANVSSASNVLGWKIATALFGVLWLISCGFIWRQRQLHAPSQPALTPLNVAPPLIALSAAIKASDPIAAATAWQAYQRQLSSEKLTPLVEQIQTELNAMMAAHYRQAATTWDNQHLLKLIKQLEKTKPATTTPSSLKPL